HLGGWRGRFPPDSSVAAGLTDDELARYFANVDGHQCIALLQPQPLVQARRTGVQHETPTSLAAPVPALLRRSFQLGWRSPSSTSRGTRRSLAYTVFALVGARRSTGGGEP